MIPFRILWIWVFLVDHGESSTISLGHPTINVSAASTRIENTPLIIPDRDQVLPVDGKIVHFKVFASVVNPLTFKILTGHIDGDSYDITNTSPLINITAVQGPGWQTAELPNGYMTFRAGEVIGIYFPLSSHLSYMSFDIGQSGCKDSGTFTYQKPLQSSSVTKGLHLTNLTIGNTCRSYAYSADFLPEGSCINITLRYQYDDKQTEIRGYYKDVIYQTLDPGDSLCWTIVAPPRGDGQPENVQVEIRLRPAGNEVTVNGQTSCTGGILRVKNGDAGTTKIICGNTPLENEMIYSTAETLTITLTAKDKVAFFEAEVWAGIRTGDTLSEQKTTMWAGVLGILIGSVILGIVVGAIIVYFTRKHKAHPPQSDNMKDTISEDENSTVEEEPAVFIQPKPGQLPAGRLPPLDHKTDDPTPKKEDGSDVKSHWLTHDPLLTAGGTVVKETPEIPQRNGNISKVAANRGQLDMKKNVSKRKDTEKLKITLKDGQPSYTIKVSPSSISTMG